MMRLAAAAGGMVGMLVCCAGVAGAVEPCPIDGNCAEVTVKGPDQPVSRGGSAQMRIAFAQGADDQAVGGVDEIAAVTLTVGIPGLELADCSAPDASGLNASIVLLGGAGRYRATVQNLTCASRPSCLCPTGGEAHDDYLDLLLVGTPTAAGVPALPDGDLLGIALRAPAGTPAHVALHLYSALDDPVEFPRPPGAALLSIGDTHAVDRTVSAETMNVRVTDGELTVAGATQTAAATSTATATITPSVVASPTASGTATVPPVATMTATATATPPECTGDCNDSGEITVNELVSGVGIALGTLPLSTCPAFDCAHTGEVGVSCLVAAVNAALNGCPGR